MASLSKKGGRFYPSLPEIQPTIESHQNALLQMRAAMRTYQREDNDYRKSFVRYEELADIGVIDRDTGNIVINEITGSDTFIELTDTAINLQVQGDFVFNSDGTVWRPTGTNLQWKETYLSLGHDISIDWGNFIGDPVEMLVLTSVGVPGAAITDEYKKFETSIFTTTSTSYVDATNHFIDVSALTDGAKYFLYMESGYGNHTANFIDTGQKIRLTEDNGTSTMTGSVGEVCDYFADGHVWQYGFTRTINAAGPDFKIQADTGGSTGTRVVNSMSFGLNLDTFPAGSYYEDEGTSIAYGTSATQTGVSVTLPSGEWLVFVNASFSSLGDAGDVELYVYDGTTHHSLSQADPEVSTNTIPMGGMRMFQAFNGTLEVSAKGAAAGTLGRAYIFALNIAAFSEYYIDVDTTPRTNPNAGGPYLTRTFTPQADGEFMCIGYCRQQWSTSGRSGTQRIELNIDSGGWNDYAYNYHRELRRNTLYSNHPVFPSTVASLTTSNSVDARFDCLVPAPSSAAEIWAEHAMIIVRLETSSTLEERFYAGDPNYPTYVDGSAIRFHDSYTFPTADGAANQVLSTDGAGNLSFIDIEGLDFNDGDYVHILGFEYILGLKQFNADVWMNSALSMLNSNPITLIGEAQDYSALQWTLGAPDTLSNIAYFEGTDGQQTYTSDFGGTTWTFTGGAKISTDQFFSGASSLYIDGTDNEYIQADSNAPFLPGSSDFTIEMWLRPSDVQHVAYIAGIQNVGSNNQSWLFRQNTSGRFYVDFHFDGATGTVALGGGTGLMTQNTWRHYVAMRKGTNIYIFVDGVQSGTTTVGATEKLQGQASITAPMRIGLNDGNFSSYHGYVDNFRFINEAVYDETGFTPPVAGSTFLNTAADIIYGDAAAQTFIRGDGLTVETDTVVDGSVSLLEKAAALDDVAAYGQFWVRDDTPNTPMFTDDAGTDYDILAHNTTHVGEVTGVDTLTLDVTAISNRTFVDAEPLDNTPIEDDTDGTLKKTTLGSITDGGFF